MIERVSIAQSRKALLPHQQRYEWRWPQYRFQSLSREKPFCHRLGVTISSKPWQFQSLSREKPFCHLLTQKSDDPLASRFNRSVAKSPSATKEHGERDTSG